VIKKPFTTLERKQMSQSNLGFRSYNDWGAGDLPAPFAEGDVVRLIGQVGDDRLGIPGRPFQGSEYFVVCYGPSVSEGDGWYFRVTADNKSVSDRLHVFYPQRCLPGMDAVNYMSAFELVDTADPEGLAEREQKLMEGWYFGPIPKVRKLL
jgi:hypothetical protein